MATSFQQKSRVRKLTYTGLIVGLFTVSLLFRQYLVEPQAFALQLRESARGEAELTSSAVRLTLLGSRGLATCVLWQMAIERQMRHQWNELEMLVQSITKLQPNFVTPWLFQSWNLAYNVAVECDRTRDKYFYVSRGLQLLAEGERRHQGTLRPVSGLWGQTEVDFPGNPEMRFYMGLYYQMKIGNSDEKNAMRCLFDMSCIDPVQRDAARFWETNESGRRVIDLKKFRQFCIDHPRLVRRLRARLRCSEPQDVLAFLEQNRGVPSRFDEKKGPQGNVDPRTDLLPPRQQFPILPPVGPNNQPLMAGLPRTTDREFAEDMGVFTASRAWYEYAQKPLPPPTTNLVDVQEDYDPVRHRMPKMMSHIFRGYPARAEEYIAQARADEGWFGGSGWTIEGWFDSILDFELAPQGPAALVGQALAAHSAAAAGPAAALARDLSAAGDLNTLFLREDAVVVGTEDRYHSTQAWQKAFEMYEDYGRRNGLFLGPDELARVEALADFYRRTFLASAGEAVRPLGSSQLGRVDPQTGVTLAESANAHEWLRMYDLYRHTTNFDSHYQQCAAERFPEVADVREMLFRAKELVTEYRNERAEAVFERAFDRWKALLLKYPEFAQVDEVQSDTYEAQMKYIRLEQDREATLLRELMTWGAELRLAVPTPAGYIRPLHGLDLTEAERRRIIPIRTVRGEFEKIYIPTLPNRRAVQNVMLTLTQATRPVPFLLSETQRDWTLVLYRSLDRSGGPPQGWYPLITESTVQSSRDRLGLTRQQGPNDLGGTSTQASE